MPAQATGRRTCGRSRCATSAISSAPANSASKPSAVTPPEMPVATGLRVRIERADLGAPRVGGCGGERARECNRVARVDPQREQRADCGHAAVGEHLRGVAGTGLADVDEGFFLARLAHARERNGGNEEREQHGRPLWPERSVRRRADGECGDRSTGIERARAVRHERDRGRGDRADIEVRERCERQFSHGAYVS